MAFLPYLWLSISEPETFPNKVICNSMKNAGKSFVVIKTLRAEWEKGKATCMIGPNFCELGEKP